MNITEMSDTEDKETREEDITSTDDNETDACVADTTESAQPKPKPQQNELAEKTNNSSQQSKAAPQMRTDCTEHVCKKLSQLEVDASKLALNENKSCSEAAIFFQKVATDNNLKLGKYEKQFLQNLSENEVKLQHLYNMSYEHWKETHMNIFMRAALQNALSEELFSERMLE